MGQSHHRSFDIEVFAPGVDQWLEVSSVSWFADYQARRAGVRYRPTGGKGTEMVHTVNGSALAVPRIWAALVETHRQPDGSIAVAECLVAVPRRCATCRLTRPHPRTCEGSPRGGRGSSQVRLGVAGSVRHG